MGGGKKSSCFFIIKELTFAKVKLNINSKKVQVR